MDLRNEEILYGDIVRITHDQTKGVLHSHNIRYTSGSRQQEVVCWRSQDNNDWFRIIGPSVVGQNSLQNCVIGSSVKNGDFIRLYHLQSNRNLHSHKGIHSPQTKQQEVSCFGQGDSNDDWIVELGMVFNDDQKLYRNRVFRLIHQNTNFSLHSHRIEAQTQNFQEVTCFDQRDDNDFWIIYEQQKK